MRLAAVLWPLVLVSSAGSAAAQHACRCQSSYSACNETAASDLVFIGTVESITPVFLNRWGEAESPVLSLNDAYLNAQDHPSAAAFARLKAGYLRAFPDLTAHEKQQVETAKTMDELTSSFYSALNAGAKVRFKVKTLFRREDDDGDDDGDEDDVKQLDVSTPFGECGVPFQRGETYLVYANADENSGVESTTTCTRTRRLSDAGYDLTYLWFYKNSREASSRFEGFTTTDREFPLNPDKMHDPESVTSPAKNIMVVLEGAGGTRRAESDEDGRFVIDGLKEGDYLLSAFAAGFPKRRDLVAGPLDLHVEQKSCVLRIVPVSQIP